MELGFVYLSLIWKGWEFSLLRDQHFSFQVLEEDQHSLFQILEEEQHSFSRVLIFSHLTILK